MKQKISALVMGAVFIWAGGAAAADAAKEAGGEAVKEERPAVMKAAAAEVKAAEKEKITAEDIAFASVKLGMEQEEVIHALGAPLTYKKGDHFITLSYEYGRDLVRKWEEAHAEKKDELKEEKPEIGTLQIAVRLPLPQSAVQSASPQHSGVERVYVTAPFFSLPAERGVRAGDGVSYLLDRYGKPAAVLRDANTNGYRFVYQDEESHKTLVFYGKERTIEAAELFYDDRGIYREAVRMQPERDFTLMGLRIGDTLQTNRYDTWQRKIEQNGNTFWFYKNYGIWTDKEKKIKRVFLINNEAYSSRGITLGNTEDTLRWVYGEPDLIEQGQEGDAPAERLVDAWYYIQKGETPVYLVFLINQKSRTVEDVILSDSQVQNMQNGSNRYGLV